MANNSTNKTEFKGWSGFTNLLSGNTPYSSFANKPLQASVPNPSLSVGPVNIIKTPKNGPSRTPSSGPVYKTGDTQTQSVSSRRSVTIPQGLNLPFTAGTVDYSFPAGGGYGTDGFDGPVYDIKVDSNGKYLVGGNFGNYYYNGTQIYSPYLIRLNPDGTVDESFNITNNWDCFGGGFNGTVYTLEIQSDGKILVGGSFSYYDNGGNCYNYNNIIRLNDDATRDLSFNVGTGFNSDVYDIHVQPDGKILVVGDFTQYNNTDAYRIIRLNSNGSIDSSFVIGDTNVGFDSYVNVIELQPDGKIIAGGYFSTYGPTNRSYITRINSDGTPDTSFQIGNGFNDEVYTIALQSDGKIIVGGYFDSFDNNPLFGGHIVRLNSNGTLDTLFGYGLDGPVHSLAIQSDGKILVGGNLSDYYPDSNNTLNVDELIRFHSDCSFDYSFYYGELLNDVVESIIILEDGNILIGGEFGNSNPEVFPLQYFGRLHNAILEYPYTYVVEDCQRPLNDFPIYYTVGSMSPLSGNDTFSFKKLSNPSVTVCGTLTNIYPSMNIDYELVSIYNSCDEAQISNAKVASTSDMFDFGEGYNLLVDSKYEVGDILYVNLVFDFMGGPAFIKTVVQIESFVPYNSGFFSSAIIPYQPYESVTDAVIPNGIHYEVRDTCQTNDNSHYPLVHKEWYSNTSILLPGFETIPCKEVVNVLTFAPYFLISGGTEEIFSVVEFEDCDECLTKMGKTGILDTSLYNNDFDGFVYTMVEQPDGKILVGGNFNEVNGNVTGSLIRLNSDGTIDGEFNQIYSSGATWSTDTPFEGEDVGGSIYFDGHSPLNANTDVPVWEFNSNDFTFEWFQYFTGNQNDKPTVFSFSDTYLSVYFYDGDIVIYVNGDTYTFGLDENINNNWWHFAITREDSTWRIFQNGYQLGSFDNGISYGTAPTTIGKPSDWAINNLGLGYFTGNITNFKVQNGYAIYTSGFDVPTEPLDPNSTPGNTVLCLLVNNEPDFILDSCDDNILTSTTSGYYLGTGFNSYIRAIALQPDGKILVGGNFHDYNDKDCPNHFVRLNSDGSLDTTFEDLGLNNLVRAIAVQGDGKIVVGGEFDQYGGVHYSNRIIRVDSDGVHDDSFVVDGGFNGSVFYLDIETILDTPFYHIDADSPSYTYNVIVGGWFSEYQELPAGGIAKLSETGELIKSFGVGFNYGEGGTPRVNQILKQSDGKLVVVGGADGGHLYNYKETNISRDIVRLEEDGFGQYNIDPSFNVPPFYYGEGGFNNGYALSITQQPDGKLIVGGSFYDYVDNDDQHNNLFNIVRLNTDGSYDSTFSMGEGFNGQVNKVLLLSNGKLLTGGRFNIPNEYLTRLYIGEEYKLHEFTECNGDLGYTYLPRTFVNTSGVGTEFTATTITYEPISTSGLDLIENGDFDDSNFFIELPLDFDVNFLGTNYTSVYVGSNSYLTFGDGSNAHGMDPFPGSIPDETGLPGVYLSTRTGDNTCLDSAMWLLYTGLTDGGNTLIVRFEGNDDYDTPQGDTNLIYNFKFYKDQSNYFDLIIEQNEFFCNDDSTGGVSNGVDGTWVTSFDTSSEKAYRIGFTGTYNPIKTNLDETPTFCGSVGSVTDTIVKTGGQGGSMSFDGTAGNVVTVDYNVAMDLDFDSWTIEWFQYYTSTDTCCRRVFDIGTFPNEHIGVSLENGSIMVWIERPSGYQFSYTLNDDIFNTWSHFAISAEDIGGNDRRIRVFQNGVELGSSQIINVDMNNFDGPTLLPLIIGGMGDGTSPFQGYITNFRWNKGTCYYTSNFSVPTSPLSVDGSQLLLLATNSNDLTYDSSENQTVSQNNVTWSELNPFGTVFNLYSADGLTTYEDCDTCKSTVLYKATLYVRDGISNYVRRYSMTSEDIANVLTYGPIFTITVGNETTRENYEILHYNL